VVGGVVDVVVMGIVAGSAAMASRGTLTMALEGEPFRTASFSIDFIL
jgi:hypothetical protein